MYRLLFFLLFTCFGPGLLAQRPDMVFHHLGEKEGLSYNFVTTFLPDDRGNLWVGTLNGLNLYDGEHFYSFRRSRKRQTIVDDAINGLSKDQRGNIWGATGNGIFRYDMRADTFCNYKTPSTRFAKVIKNVLCDRYGDVWATGEWNMMRYDPAKDAFVDLPQLTTHRDSIAFYSVQRKGILEDPQGRGIWFATRKGLHFYDRLTRRFRNFRQPGGSSLFDEHNYNAFCLTARQQCWVYDRTTGQALLFDPVSMVRVDSLRIPDSLNRPFVTTLFEDRSGRLWLSTWNEGVYFFDRSRGSQFIRLKHELADPTTIAGEIVWDIMQDGDGTIWCGTNNGISRSNPDRSIYTLYDFGKSYPGLKNVAINAMEEDPVDGTWWIAFATDQVGNYVPTSGKLTLMNPKKEAPPGDGGPFYWPHTFRFYSDTVFACTRNGIWFFSRVQHQWRPYSPVFERQRDFVFHDMIRMNDSIEIVTDNQRLYRWNRRTRKALLVNPVKDTLPNGQTPTVNYINKTPDGNAWFTAGFGWLGKMDPAGRIDYIRMQDKSRLDYNGYYTGLRTDRQGRIWLPNKGAGIDMYDPARREVISFFQGDGLVSDDIGGVIPDISGLVWACAFNRFSVFRPGSGNFYNFSIPINQGIYNYDIYTAQTRSGKIVFTANDHLLVFSPDRLQGRPQARVPQISAIRVNGKDRLLFGDSVVHLDTRENSLSFRFGWMADKELFPYRLRYQLSGVDDSFMVAGPSAEAVYTNLAPGKYKFRLRAESDNNAWASSEVSVTVIIRTPFWRTRFFAILVMLTFAACLYLLYRYRIRHKERLLHLESKAQLLEKEKALVMYENLKQHLNPHFLFNSLTSLGSLIRVDGRQAGDFLDKMSKVYRYVLKNRDNETVPLGEEVKFVQLYNELQRTRFGASLQIHLRIDEEHFHRKIAPVTLQNLVENAIKHNTADPESPLVIELFVEDDYLVVRNNLQRKEFVETSNKQGLLNMESLYRFLSDRKMLIEENEKYFTVKIPLI